MPSKPKLNVHSFPRPPRLEKTLRHLQIKWNGHLIADTRDAYWVLETTHAPSKSSFPLFFLPFRFLSFSCLFIFLSFLFLILLSYSFSSVVLFSLILYPSFSFLSRFSLLPFLPPFFLFSSLDFPSLSFPFIANRISTYK